jgi:hypothetical protein
MLAVLLLAAAISGPLSIASKGLSAALVAKDQITAFYLAQDAMEQVRFLRDSNCLSAGAGGCTADKWMLALGGSYDSSSSLWSGVCFSATGCYLDSLANNPTVPTVCDTQCAVLKYDPTTHAYQYTNGVDTPQQFRRTITITQTVPDEVTVTVSVSWKDLSGSTHMPAVLRENLSRWQ